MVVGGEGRARVRVYGESYGASHQVVAVQLDDGLRQQWPRRGQRAHLVGARVRLRLRVSGGG